MPPLPAAQGLGGGVELAGGVGHVVVLQRRDRGGDACAVRLIRRLARVVLGLAALPGLADGKERRGDQPQDQSHPGAGHPAHQARVPPRELAQAV